LLTLAFAPFHFAVLAFICPAILLGQLLNAASVKRVAWLGWLFGIGFFGCSVSWIFVSIHTFGQLNIIIAALLTLLFVMVLALFPSVTAICTRICVAQLARRRAVNNLHHISLFWLLIIYPIAWVAFELLRGWIGTGFPWVLVGYSQIDTPLRGFAPIIGVYGLSWLALICAILIYRLCMDASVHPVSWRRRLLLLLSLGVLLGSGDELTRIHWSKPLSTSLSTSIIQGNFPQMMKWDPDQFTFILQTYYDLTKPELQHDLIIWPEGAIPAPSYVVTDYLAQLETELTAHHSTLLLGTFLAGKHNAFYNAILVIGSNQGSYTKRHLVPFGEYLPLRPLLSKITDWLQVPMSDLAVGPRQQALITVNQLKLSASICYEIAYPALIWQDAAQANILVNISDDSWFGHSLAAAQQLQMSQMRALETGRPMLLANNDGVTASISAQGQIVSKLPIDQRQILHTTVQGYTGATPLVWLMSR
jgi:apolipoprotein N-acyltransferase